jgi:hypothetical protein
MTFNLSSVVPAAYAPYVLPGSIVLITALVVILLLIGRRKGGAKLKKPKLGRRSELSDDSAVAGASLGERRTSVRRDGAVVEVVVASPALKGGRAGGYVLDRSTGGLKLALASGMAVGSTMQVTAKHAPDTTPPVTVIVRSCRNNGEHFELGCEFEKTPPWNVLLLFG